MSELYNRIKQRREELNMTQEELAKILGYKSRSSINKIEMGENDIPQSKIKAFAVALKTTTTYLMGGQENKTPDCDIAESYNKLDAVDRADVKGYINGLLRADKYNKSNNQSSAC